MQKHAYFCLISFWIMKSVDFTLFSKTVTTQQYCSFFDNRAPRPQSNLKNCTWFKENSCCMQEEIDATFGRVKPLPGASKACMKYMNYLMCYICAPNQNIFYSRERLTVCEEFCNGFYDACKSAILKGSIIRDLYSNGTQFCHSRSYEVSTVSKQNCFTFDVMLDDNLATRHSNSNVLIWLSLLVYIISKV